MFIHEAIFEKASQLGKDYIITDIRVGLGYTCVELDNASLGLSYTFTKELNFHSCNVLDLGDSIIGKSALSLLKQIFSYNLLDSVLAIACANAILNKPQSESSNFLDLIEEHYKVVMVGYFAPIIDIIRTKCKQLVIIERDSRFDSLPDYASFFELSNCDIAIISATTLVNKTIDGILNFSNAKYNIILGATCVMDKEVFSGSRVSHLCGVSINNKHKVKSLVSIGAGTKLISKYTKKECVLCF